MKLGVLAETARIMTGCRILIDVLLEGETVKRQALRLLFGYRFCLGFLDVLVRPLTATGTPVYLIYLLSS